VPTWDELFTNQEHRWLEPHEKVVEFFSSLKPEPGEHVLDLGCGAGRHIVYVAREGYQVVGMDLSWNGLAFSQKWIERENLTAELARADMVSLPFQSDLFHAVISVHVIFHNPLRLLRKSIEEIRRVLCPGGRAFITFQSKRSYRYGKGLQVEPDTFIPDIGADSGIPHHYSDLHELADLLDGFVIHKIELLETSGAEEQKSSHWGVFLEKQNSN